MFIGYLKNGFEELLEELLSSNPLLDISLLQSTYEAFPQFCFAAYENSKIVGVISAYSFEKYLYVNVFEAMEEFEDVYKRLLTLLKKNRQNQDIVLLIQSKKIEILKELGFSEYEDFVRVMHKGEAVAFNFSNSTAKQVSGEHYDEVSRKVDKKVFNQNREEYIKKDCVFSNSLKLSTTQGYLHSYVINKRYIKISPWLMNSETFLDAEKLLRGVLYYRGLKKIFAYAPKNEKEIVELYQSYKFEIDGDFKLMYLIERPNISLENLYGL